MPDMTGGEASGGGADVSTPSPAHSLGEGEGAGGDDAGRGLSSGDAPVTPDDAPEATVPVRLRERIVMLDVLRGVAVLGILLINIPGFAIAWDGVPDNKWAGVDGPLDKGAAILAMVFVEGSMRGLFSLLFGAGIILLTTRLESRRPPLPRRRAAAIYYRRTAWLIVFGLVHAYVLLWPGDILYFYGVNGLWLWFLRHLRAKWLLIIGLVLLLGGPVRAAIEHLDRFEAHRTATLAQAAYDAGEIITDEQHEAIDEWNEQFQFDHEAHDAEVAAMRSGYWTIMKRLAPDNFMEHTIGFFMWAPWDIASVMLIGMALMKWGVLSGARSTNFYGKLLAIGYSVGLTVNIAEEVVREATNYDPLIEPFTWYSYDLGRLPLTLGHIGLVALLMRAGVAGAAMRGLSAAGRMALTNYIAQTVICVLLFYGVGFALFDRLMYGELVLVVLAIWAAEITWSVLWLRRFRFGPLEWAWRSLTYWKRQPLSRAADLEADGRAA
jgi:uncharacterized protein